VAVYFAALAMFFRAPHDTAGKCVMTAAIAFLVLAIFKSQDRYLRISTVVSVAALVFEVLR
jgi:hypothetical protein